MLYSIISQINKGLRRIPILRKSEIAISLQIVGGLDIPGGSPLSDNKHRILQKMIRITEHVMIKDMINS
jgi:hypothetical protein